MGTHNIESAEKSATHTLHDTNEVAKRDGSYPYAVVFTHDGSYTYRLAQDSADTTSKFLAGVVYAMRPKLLKATGAPSGATTCTLWYRS